MKRTLLLLSFLAGSLLPAFAQKLDSLSAALVALPDDTVKFKKLNKLAAELAMTDLKQSLAVLFHAKAVAQKLGKSEWVTEVHAYIGSDYANLGMPDSALYYFNLAKAANEKAGKERIVAGLLMNIRYAYNYKGDYEKANQCSFEALAIFEKLHIEDGIAMSYLDIGSNLLNQSKLNEAETYLQKAYDLNKKLGIEAEIAISAQVLGKIYLDLGDCDKALRYLNESLSILRKLDNAIQSAQTLSLRGEAFKCQNSFDDALRDYQESIDLAKKIGYTTLEYECTSFMGNLFNSTGAFGKALPLHLKFFRYLKEGNGLSGMSVVMGEIARSYAGLGRFDSAYFYRTEQFSLSDSLLNAENQTRMSELQTKYETAQKEAKIEQQNAQLARERRQFWVLAAGLFLALVAGLGLFLLTRKLRQRNREKEFLVKEIHHRVKNNLQVLGSLLYLQSRHIRDEAALDAIREGQNRVEAMSLIHQKLYLTDNLASVNMTEYLKELGDSLLESFGQHNGQVEIHYAVQPLKLDVDTAIPLGLIINELLTNSLKYAFSEKGGIIEITLSADDIGRLLLKVADNGAGTTAANEAKKSTGFGSSLIEMLSGKLKGKPEVTASEKGYSTLIRFEKVGIIR